jgi:preprotein translocase subunit SecY
MKLFKAIENTFRFPDLRKRILFTFLMLAAYRLASAIC